MSILQIPASDAAPVPYILTSKGASEKMEVPSDSEFHTFSSCSDPETRSEENPSWLVLIDQSGGPFSDLIWSNSIEVMKSLYP